MGRRRIRFSREAATEIVQALSWWEANRPDAPEALRSELRRGLELIRALPRAGAKERDKGNLPVRRLNLHSTRYHLYYAVSADDSSIVVLSLWHWRRGSGPDL